MINDLINEKSIEIYLQPIVSIKDKKIFAYEALTRATDRYGEPISPLYLFEQAKKENLSIELDEYVRELALLKFSKYYHQDKEVLLFVNFEASVIDSAKKDKFISVVHKYNISPSNIVIEVKEDRIKDSHALKQFIDAYRNKSFLIAIDDFGTGYSSFDRLEFIKPDIVKIDRSLIYNVHNNFINKEILTAVSHMCHNIGAMVLGEGVESRDEILTCVKKGIDVFQGFWFCKPQNEIDESMREEIFGYIDNVGNQYKNSVKELIKKKQALLQNSQQLAQKVLSTLEISGISDMSDINQIISQDDKLEAIYIIDSMSGIQIGDTLIDAQERHLYTPTKNGNDHSLKEYYFIANESLRGDYLSKRYISKASGHMCRTYASKITLNDVVYIVCFDIVD